MFEFVNKKSLIGYDKGLYNSFYVKDYPFNAAAPLTISVNSVVIAA